MQHQQEEAETRALGRAMIADAAEKRPSFNNSCAKLLNNFQGITLLYLPMVFNSSDLSLCFLFIFHSGALDNLKRNQVKLHDNVLLLIQEKEEERKERKMFIDIILQLREEVKILVRISFSLSPYLFFRAFFYPSFFFHRLQKEKSIQFLLLIFSPSKPNKIFWISSMTLTVYSKLGAMAYTNLSS